MKVALTPTTVDRSSLTPLNHGLAFRWTETGGMQGLPCLPGDNVSSANAISADCSTIVGYSDSPAGQWRAVRWNEFECRAISDDGSRIVGFRIRPPMDPAYPPSYIPYVWDEAIGWRGVEQKPFILEPAAATWLTFGLCALWGRRKRRCGAPSNELAAENCWTSAG